jgi:hypothetical protein
MCNLEYEHHEIGYALCEERSGRDHKPDRVCCGDCSAHDCGHNNKNANCSPTTKPPTSRMGSNVVSTLRAGFVADSNRYSRSALRTGLFVGVSLLAPAASNTAVIAEKAHFCVMQASGFSSPSVQRVSFRSFESPSLDHRSRNCERSEISAGSSGLMWRLPVFLVIEVSLA